MMQKDDLEVPSLTAEKDSHSFSFGSAGSDAGESRGGVAEPYVMTDTNGDRWTFDPACTVCVGTGRYVAGYSGREDDGNAPLWEDCDCFIPAGVGAVAAAEAELEEMRQHGNADDATEAAAHLERVRQALPNGGQTA